MKSAQMIALLEAMAVLPGMYKEAAPVVAKVQHPDEVSRQLAVAEAKRERKRAKQMSRAVQALRKAQGPTQGS